MGFPAVYAHDIHPFKFGEPSTGPCYFAAHFPRGPYPSAHSPAAMPVPTHWRAAQSTHRAQQQPIPLAAVNGAARSHPYSRPLPNVSLAPLRTTASTSPPAVHVVCTAPLLAPKPLPYHSPTFLHFDLPDDDEDLSHPPYVARPHKRKRAADDDSDDSDSAREERGAKRRATERARWHLTQRPSPPSHPPVPLPISLAL